MIQRCTGTGMRLCVSTLCVSLPGKRSSIPRRPCDALHDEVAPPRRGELEGFTSRIVTVRMHHLTFHAVCAGDLRYEVQVPGGEGQRSLGVVAARRLQQFHYPLR